jgi:UDP-glucose 4-epimerase
LDLAAAHLLVLGAIETDNCTYHLGNGGGFSVRQVIETARTVTGRRIPEVIGQRRPGDPPRLVANSDKIRRELGWQPQFGELEQIVSSAWRWHQAFPTGYSE